MVKELITMDRRSSAILMTTAATVAAILSTATSAAAQTTVTITNSDAGGNFSAHSGDVVLAVGGTAVECMESDITGNIPTGTYMISADAKIGTVDSLTFNNCTGSFGTITVTTHVPDNIWLDQFPGVESDGVTPADGNGYLESSGGNGAALATVHVATCSFDVVGDAPWYWLNPGDGGNPSGTSEWVFDHSVPLFSSPRGATPLTVANVSGCLGQVNNGDLVTWDGTYIVEPAITIGSGS